MKKKTCGSHYTRTTLTASICNVIKSTKMFMLFSSSLAVFFFIIKFSVAGAVSLEIMPPLNTLNTFALSLSLVVCWWFGFVLSTVNMAHVIVHIFLVVSLYFVHVALNSLVEFIRSCLFFFFCVVFSCCGFIKRWSHFSTLNSFAVCIWFDYPSASAKGVLEHSFNCFIESWKRCSMKTTIGYASILHSSCFVLYFIFLLPFIQFMWWDDIGHGFISLQLSTISRWVNFFLFRSFSLFILFIWNIIEM